jgi:hypothetical protein
MTHAPGKPGPSHWKRPNPIARALRLLRAKVRPSAKVYRRKGRTNVSAI